MKIDPFLLERNQSLYENSVQYNLTESGVHPYSLSQTLSEDELREMAALPLGYGYTNGAPSLRRAVAGLYRGRTESNILITNGSAEANFAVIWSLIEPGDEVAVMLPNYMLVSGLLDAFGAIAKPFQLREELKWAPDLNDLRSTISPKTKMIVVCNPNNPTGAVLDRATMEALAGLDREHGCYILSDEIYRGSELDGIECPSFLDVYEKAIVCSGLSKALAHPGLRIGWIAGPAEVIASCWHRHDYTTITTSIVSQYVAEKILQPERRKQILAYGRELLNRNLGIFSHWIGERKNSFHFIPPKAGGMAFVRYSNSMNSSALVTKLREEKSVLVVAGDWFGMDHYLRFGIGTDSRILEAGLALITQTFKEMA